MNHLDKKILESVYTLSDDIDYNLYEASDVADYAALEVAVVQERMQVLYEQGYLGECLRYEDDGMETFHLTPKGWSLLTNVQG